MKIAIVVSEFNLEITSRMLEAAQDRAAEIGLDIVKVCHVPGAYDIPYMVNVLFGGGQIDGIATLGAVIKGKTKHDEIISHVTASTLQSLSIKYDKPVSLGVTGPGMTERQAYARIRPVARHAIESLVYLHKEAARVRS
ncbi:MAG: 6,7-dimethyl-8-ribityllumazine synthase [Cenarchaeum sp. SB0663_bin_5]|nr:6,7-dimethyl-8-ribityllumazine synthase [Cenarchaeum sp. SB0663_bin_5]MYH03353.1 6,7-dimethyl-8-ribityllumazine synthase [Cenarchaeum sp. SB0675_bin_21]MYL10894.1 6,7-dimethyl-8-ribityllumazine synthase [Cenarchaeum sp. SB0669_bin_11]